MCRQIGKIIIEGTIDNVTFYQLDGAHYARMKFHRTRKQYFQDPKLANSRLLGYRMMVCCKVALGFYNTMPRFSRHKSQLNDLKKRVMYWLKSELSIEEVVRQTGKYVIGQQWLISKQVREIVPALISDPTLYRKPAYGDRKPYPDEFRGVRLRTSEGRVLRLYHMDELELIYNTYDTDAMQESDFWVEDFLSRRRQMEGYRKRPKRFRRSRLKVQNSTKPKFLVRVSKFDVPEGRKSCLRIKGFVRKSYSGAPFFTTISWSNSIAVVNPLMGRWRAEGSGRKNIYPSPNQILPRGPTIFHTRNATKQ